MMSIIGSVKLIDLGLSAGAIPFAVVVSFNHSSLHTD
jgi:hypothetical protein